MTTTAPANEIHANAVLAPTDALRRSVFQFVRRRVRDAHLAEDLTQEILLKAAAKQSSVRYKEHIAGWLFQIARNVVASHFRRERPTEQWLESTRATEEVHRDDAITAEEEVLRRGLFRYIRQVVESLSPIYRDALIATDYEGISQVELARREGISISAAKSRVQRARVEVRRIIEACCHFKTDAYGTVVDCNPVKKPGCDRC